MPLYIAVAVAAGVVLAAIAWLTRRSDRSIVDRMRSPDRVDASGNPDSYTPHSHI